MVVDAHGRAYVGNFGFDLNGGAAHTPTNLALAHPDGRVEVAASDLLFPNGTVLTPDGRPLIVAETFAARLTAFDVADDGRLSKRRVWAQLDARARRHLPRPGERDLGGFADDARAPARARARPRIAAHRVRRAVGDRVHARRRRSPHALPLPPRRTTRRRRVSSGRIERVEVEVPGAGWP
jgi:hypothetical protein